MNPKMEFEHHISDKDGLVGKIKALGRKLAAPFVGCGSCKRQERSANSRRDRPSPVDRFAIENAPSERCETESTIGSG